MTSNWIISIYEKQRRHIQKRYFARPDSKTVLIQRKIQLREVNYKPSIERKEGEGGICGNTPE